LFHSSGRASAILIAFGVRPGLKISAISTKHHLLRQFHGPPLLSMGAASPSCFQTDWSVIYVANKIVSKFSLF
jgi:hypothetical protein